MVKAGWVYLLALALMAIGYGFGYALGYTALSYCQKWCLAI